MSSLHNPDADVTSPEIRFYPAPVGKDAWFSSVSLFDSPQGRQGNTCVSSDGLGWREGLRL